MDKRWRCRARVVLLLAVATVCSLGAAAPSPAAQFVRVRPFARSFGPLRSDGRYAVYQPSLSTTAIVDSHRNTVTVRADPSGCARVLTTAGWYRGGVSAVGGGEILYECATACPGGEWACLEADRSQWQVRLVVVGIATGRSHELTRLAFGEPGFTLTGIGSRWIAGAQGEYRVYEPFFVDWRTGAVVRAHPTRSTRVDLSSPTPELRYCEPIRRHIYEGSAELAGELGFESPWALDESPWSGKSGPTRTGAAIVLRHCGTTRVARVAALPPTGEVEEAQVSGGVATWITSASNESAWFWVMRLARRFPWHRQVYRLFGPTYREVDGGLQRGRWSLAHTDTAVYQSDAVQERPGIEARDGLNEIFAAGIP